MHTHLRIAAFATLALGLACQNSAQPRREFGVRESSFIPDAAATLMQNWHSGFTQSAQIVVDDAAEWASVWAQLYASQSPVPEVPPVDFNAARVVVEALGERPSAGYAIGIDSIVEFEQGTTVFTTATRPGASCVTAAVMTQPVHAVRAPVLTGTISFERRSRIQECS